MTMVDRTNWEQFQQQLSERGLAAAAGILRGLPAADRADLVHQLPAAHRVAVLTALSASDVSEMLEYLVSMGSETMESVGQLPIEALTLVLDRTPIGTVARVLRAFGEERRLATLATLRDAAAVGELVAQEEDTAGALVTTDFMALRVGMTAEQATRSIRRTRPSNEHLERLFVVDRENRLAGNISFRDLFLAEGRTPLSSIMTPETISVLPDTDQEECARLMERYHLQALPIVDAAGKLIGFIDISDVLEVAEDEATEDMYRLVGLNEEEAIASSVWSSLRSRLPWLSLNLATVFAAAGVVALFESTVARVAILAAFLPVVGGQGGVATMQTITIMVRSIALGDVSGRTWRRVLVKETVLGLLQGLSTAVAAGVAVLVWTQDVKLAAVLAGALVLVMMVAGLSGVLIPIGLRRAGIDPALASGVFGTTITDIFGFAFLLGLATLVLHTFGW